MRSIYYSLFFLAPLVLNSATSELFEFNKMMLIYIAALLVLFTWTIKSIHEKKIILRRTILDIPIIIFFTSQLLSTIFSIDRWTSFLGYYGRFNGGLLSLISYFVLYYGFVTFFSYENIVRLLKISLISSVVVILWGLPGHFGKDLSCLVFTGQWSNSCWTEAFRPTERMFSTLGQPNWLGAYLAIHFFVGLFFYFDAVFAQKKSSVKAQIVFLSYLVLVSVGILFSRSRSSYLGVMIGAGVFLLLSANVFWLKSKDFFIKTGKALGYFVIAGLLLVLIVKTGVPSIDKFITFAPKGQEQTAPVKKTFAPTSLDVTESLDIRKIVWQGAWELGFKYPLLGTGPETFAYTYYQVRPKAHNLTSEWDYLYNKAHNEYLNYFATTGFSGIISYLLFIGVFLALAARVVYLAGAKISKTQYKENDARYGLEKALVAAWVTILATNFFGFSTTTINLFFYLIPAMLLIVSLKDNPSNLYTFEIPWRAPKAASYVVVSLGTFLILMWFALYYVADTQYALATAYMQAGDYPKAATLLSEALAVHDEPVYQDKFSYSLANMALIAAYQKETKAAQTYIKQADSFNVKSINASANNPIYWKTRGKNYYLFYQVTLDKTYLIEAVKALEEDRRLAPTDPKIPYTLAVFYSILDDTEKDKDLKTQYQDQALRYATLTTELKPDYRDGYFILGQLYRKFGNKEQAIDALTKALKLSPKDKDILLELDELQR